MRKFAFVLAVVTFQILTDLANFEPWFQESEAKGGLYPQVERVTSTSISINSQGSSGAPLSVTNSVATVIPFNGTRHEWSILAETVSIRCIACATTPCSPAPSATVGFLIPFGSIVLEQVAPSLAVQCFSTGAATNVDTWEDN